MTNRFRQIPAEFIVTLQVKLNSLSAWSNKRKQLKVKAI